MHDARVGQQRGRPRRPCIIRIHLEPDGIDAEIGLSEGFEELLLRPPGGGYTVGSRWRDEKDDSHLVAIALEQRTEVGDPVQIFAERATLSRLALA